MTIEELAQRFPEIPADLHGEPVLERFAAAFDDLLRQSRSPSNCSTQHEAAHHYYLKLVGPLSIYGYGLSTRDEVLAEVAALLERHDTDPEAFAAGLLPGDGSSGGS